MLRTLKNLLPYPVWAECSGGPAKKQKITQMFPIHRQKKNNAFIISSKGPNGISDRVQVEVEQRANI